MTGPSEEARDSTAAASSTPTGTVDEYRSKHGICLTYYITFAAKEEREHLGIPSNWMSGDAVDVPLQVPPPRLDEVITEPSGILLLWKGREGESRKQPRQGSVQRNEMGEPPVKSDTHGLRRFLILIFVRSRI